MTRDFTQPARERQEQRRDHASRPSRLTQRGPRKRDTVNEGHETSWLLQVRIGEVFAYGCVLSFQKGEEGPQKKFRDDPREHRPGAAPASHTLAGRRSATGPPREFLEPPPLLSILSSVKSHYSKDSLIMTGNQIFNTSKPSYTRFGKNSIIFPISLVSFSV